MLEKIAIIRHQMNVDFVKNKLKIHKIIKNPHFKMSVKIQNV